ncbi:S41 family peptidase [Lysinibacillus macroides]|uniref:Peptidase S41 n=1 Tax=Lysinibacillus macroides TaxID=33935 RepID=A0A0N0CX05_9BACI|nr:S41 family peptidase [Lysinibacillus macroides]KOY83717.1 peptidase S41 [Lysinibacillus macroides]QPR70341.1 S41 family peptidase [Lysinibacillus macroides]
MDEQKKDRTEQQEPTEAEVKPAGQFIQLKPFKFIMLMFFTILITAGLTIFALTFGDKKVVEVKVPVERAEFTKLYEAFDLLKNKYYQDIDDEKVVDGAINGMFDALGDPYSDFMVKEEAEQFNTGLSSSFQGIGAEIQERNGYITVVSPIKNSPAEKAGLLPKDIILTVDGKSIQGFSATEAVALIRGEKGTPVKLTVKRGENTEPIQMTIVRDDIPVETVYGELLDGNIAHIQITSFSEDTAKELETILAEYEGKGMKGIVLDLRQNPGGYLNAAEAISNLFVPEGKAIVQVQEKGEEPQIINATGGKKYNLPVTVLVDGGSASASEILAGALKESVGAKVVGETSFGKGTVQNVAPLRDGSNLKFTTGKWLTPNGNWINEKGIEPDVKVAYPSYASLPYLNASLEMKEGMQSESIKAAEEMLQVLGYEPGEVDGIFDNNTQRAIEELQTANNLEQTGILTGNTTYALMDALRAKMKADDPQLLKAKELLVGATEKTEETTN